MTNIRQQKRTKMTLKGYYDSLPRARYPKTEFINRIVCECGVTSTTARNWIAGFTKPSEDTQKVAICKITGIPYETLWK